MSLESEMNPSPFMAGETHSEEEDIQRSGT